MLFRNELSSVHLLNKNGAGTIFNIIGHSYGLQNDFTKVPLPQDSYAIVLIGRGQPSTPAVTTRTAETAGGLCRSPSSLRDMRFSQRWLLTVLSPRI
jgi:hypothetical protein